jgi:serine phosphatase RsbU (regulator of sigma subunit)
MTLALLALLAASLVVGGWALRTVVGDLFRSAEGVRTARIFAAEVLRAQLDEETGIRGYATIHQNILLGTYYEGRASFPGAVARLRRALEERRLTLALRALDDATYVNRRWNEHVAVPLRSRKPGNSYLELHGKWLVDRFRIDMARIDAALANEEALIDQRAEDATLSVGIFAATAVVVVVLAAVLFAVQQYRLGVRLEQQRAQSEEERRKAAETRAALETERRIADTLQEAFAQRVLPTLPTVAFSATYLPATEEAKIGGDWYDAMQLPEDRILLAIGDVTGHGIEAAMAMNKARQLLIGSALLDAEPSRVLERVNSALVREGAPLITAIAGVVDTRTYELAYASAGHPPPVLREPGRPPRLLDFGSLPLGVGADSSYSTHRFQTVPGAMIVLYTDGVIEHSRDLAAGEAALLEAVESVAGRPDAEAATAIRDRIFSRREIADDVAILTIRFAGAAGEPPERENTFTMGANPGKLSELGPSALWRSA